MRIDIIDRNNIDVWENDFLRIGIESKRFVFFAITTNSTDDNIRISVPDKTATTVLKSGYSIICFFIATYFYQLAY